MCGVSFYCSIEKPQHAGLLSSLTSTAHRGPDASGVYNSLVGNQYVGLGHNRLSIIDLNEQSNQPMSRGGLVISFNGEIYNYLALKNDLLSMGHSFSTSSDTEVILAAYQEYGIESFSKLQGMFVFSILDTVNKALFVVRDCVGIKPIYIFENATGVFGCSEIKGLKQFDGVDLSISRDQLFEFMNVGFVSEPGTGYKYVKKLPAGTYLRIDLESGVKSNIPYASISDYVQDKELAEVVSDSVLRQQVSDAPLGLFFSGGMDSGILASLGKNLGLLFAKYENNTDGDIDLRHAELIADYLKCDLRISDVSSEGSQSGEILASIRYVAENTEELISDYTFWPTYLLSKAARDAGYKVMLSGMGGDEAFAGYPRYLVLKYHLWVKLFTPFLSLIKKIGLVPKHLDKKFDRLISYCSEPYWPLSYSRLLGYFSKNELMSLFGDFDGLNAEYLKKLERTRKSFVDDSGDKVKLGQHFDLSGFLAHNLMVADKASMLASIELRVPLLGESVLAHGLKTNSKDLIRKKQLKYPLRRLLLSLLPRELVDRPKTGFNPPLDNLISTLGATLISQEVRVLEGLIDIAQVDFLISQHFSGEENNTYKIWQLIYLAQWIKLSTK